MTKVKQHAKISDLIRDLENAKKELGDIPIIFSQDEEGNAYIDGYYLDKVENRICLYPCGDYLEI